MIRWAALLADLLMQSPCHPFFRPVARRFLVSVAVRLMVGRMRKRQGAGRTMGLMGKPVSRQDSGTPKNLGMRVLAGSIASCDYRQHAYRPRRFGLRSGLPLERLLLRPSEARGARARPERPRLELEPLPRLPLRLSLLLLR